MTELCNSLVMFFCACVCDHCVLVKHPLESPLFSGRDSIKQKMAAFQRLMGMDEENTEHSDLLMKEEKQKDEKEEGKTGARHPLSGQFITINQLPVLINITN